MAQKRLLDDFLGDQQIEPRILWFCTPGAFAVAGQIEAPLVVYDCTDEEPEGAPIELRELRPTTRIRRSDAARLFRGH